MRLLRLQLVLYLLALLIPFFESLNLMYPDHLLGERLDSIVLDLSSGAVLDLFHCLVLLLLDGVHHYL